MTEFTHKKILLGLTGGIAAYKSAELVRLLSKAGHEVQVVMTEAATRFITPVTLQALSGRPVHTDLWDPRVANNMAHIDLSRAADIFLIAPASADCLAKLAHGMADDLLTTLALARNCPLVVAPAMNRQMWEHPATQRNVQQLEADGVQIIGPDNGVQACGETGDGRMLEPDAILEELAACFQPKFLAGAHVLVTAGPTVEAIDPVRAITNTSSGKMGYAVARAAREAGARVTLISGPTALSVPRHVHLIPVQSALEMHAAVMQQAAHADLFFSVAAVADFRVAQPAAGKIKKDKGVPQISLVANPDILSEVAKMQPGPFCVGFAAETDDLITHAEAKRRRKGVPLLAANLAQAAIGQDDNALVLLDDTGCHRLERADKLTIARQLVAHAARLWRAQSS